MSSRFPIQRNSNPFCWSWASTLQSLQQNLFPPGLRVDDASRHLFSEGEKKAVLSFSFKFQIFFASFHAASPAHRSCHSVSSWDRSSNFGALGLCWWGSPGQIIPSEGLWCRMLAWRNTALVNRTHRIGFSVFELFRKIVVDFGGSISWDTQPNCHVLFQHSHCTFVTFLLRPFAWLFNQPGGVHKSTFPKICIHFRTCKTSILEDAIFHRMEWCKFLWGRSLHGSRAIFPLGLLPLELLVPDAFFTLCCVEEILEKDSAVSILHAYSSRVGNCNCLLSNTAR